ncbi:MAG: lysophospholipase [Myxococcota bacterium]|nr:lysophospholipase [Myxococcota bacterium]
MSTGENIRRLEGRRRMDRGGELFYRGWLGFEPQRLMLLVHGFGEHSGRYEEMASWFARRGFAVFALDLQGHGRTPGRRGHVADFEFFLDDVEEFLAAIRGDYPGLPAVVVGHSMGGLIVAALASRRGLSVDAFVLSGPALTLAPGISRFRLALARTLRRVLPRLSLEAGLDLEGLSRDPEVVRRYRADPLVHGRVTAAMGAGMMDLQTRIDSSARQVNRPVLLLHGEEDPLCAVQGSRDFFAGLPKDRDLQSELRVYPGLKHEIFNEPEREQIWSDVLAWLDRIGRDRGIR